MRKRGRLANQDDGRIRVSSQRLILPVVLPVNAYSSNHLNVVTQVGVGESTARSGLKKEHASGCEEEEGGGEGAPEEEAGKEGGISLVILVVCCQKKKRKKREKRATHTTRHIRIREGQFETETRHPGLTLTALHLKPVVNKVCVAK